jgi:hypothetical protein
MERRYGLRLMTLFVSFTYGFSIPLLFIVTFMIFVLQYILDKLLITYYFKEKVLYNDLLDRISLRVAKFGVALFLFFGGFAIASNNCMIVNSTQMLLYTNDILQCFAFWK